MSGPHDKADNISQKWQLISTLIRALNGASGQPSLAPYHFKSITLTVQRDDRRADNRTMHRTVALSLGFAGL